MTRATVLLLAGAAAVLPSVSAAQGLPVRARTAGFYERYSFDSGRKISEVAVPVSLDVTLGRFGNLALSSGYVSIELDSAGAQETLAGVLDTELRLGFNVVPGRLIALMTGTLPTGLKSVDTSQVAVIGALASDVVGFAVSSVGTGGTVGGGLVGAVPLGRWAIGLGANYSYALSYEPVVGDSREIRPGAEIRGRVGVEGPLGRTTYLRVTTVVARRGKDLYADTTQNGIGTRFIGYLELAQGFGNSQLTLYGYDVYRGSPQLEPTVAGRALLPKGNLVVGGLRFSLPVTQSLTIVPRAEVRISSLAPSQVENGVLVQQQMRNAGQSVRFGMDVRQRLTNAAALVVTGSYLSGKFRGRTASGGLATFDGLSGYRFGLVLDVTP
jgi:hypothetical protein